MHSAPGVANEWSLNMNSDRKGASPVIGVLERATFNSICQPFECAQSCIHGSGDRSWEITRDAVPRQQLFNRRQRIGGIVHDVISGTAVNMKVNVARS